jgi:ABC-2 type transport system permease protein
MTHAMPHARAAAFSATRLFAIAKKETIQLRRDARSLGLAFLLPVILLLLFGSAITTDIRQIKLAVLDRDNSAESRRLVDAFARSDYFVLERTLATPAEAEALIDRGVVRVALVIPERFAADLSARRPSEVEVVLDGSDAKTATIAMGYANAIAQRYSTTVLMGARTVRPAARAETRVWFNESLDGRAMVVPGLIAVIMSIISAMLTSLTIAREWERGTMEQLAATPERRVEVIFGKLLPYLAIGIIDVAVALLTSLYVFDVPFRGSLLLFSLSSLIFLLGVLGLGILISIKLKSQLLATQASIFATYMPALLLSGFFFALSSMPKLLQWISNVIPAKYFVSVTRWLFLRGVGIDVVWAPLLGLSIYAVFVLAMGVKHFKKELA